MRLGQLCALLMLLWWTPPSVSAQGVLSGLLDLSLDGTSLDDPRLPLARRVAQARALGHLGERDVAVGLLVETLSRRPQQPLRDAVIEALAERRSQHAVPELLSAARGRIGSVPLIFKALTAIGGAKAIAACVEWIQANDRVLREPALRALAKLAPEQAEPLLIKALGDVDVTWRSAALQIAIDVPDARWLPALISAASSSSSSSSSSSTTSSSAVSSADQAARRDARQVDVAFALARIERGQGVGALINLAKAATSQPALVVLVALATALRVHGEALSADQRQQALSLLRVQTASQRLLLRALARDAIDVDELDAALHDTDSERRLSAARAIEWLGETKLQPQLRAARAREADASVYNALSLACAATRCEDSDVAQAPQSSLAKDAAFRPGQLLMAAVTSTEPHSQRLRVQLRHALRANNGHSVEARVAAALGLGWLADVKGWIVLAAAATDPDAQVRRAAVRALSLFGHSDARAVLSRCAVIDADREIAALCQRAADLGAAAWDDPWGKARSLLQTPLEREAIDARSR